MFYMETKNVTQSDFINNINYITISVTESFFVANMQISLGIK